MSTQLDRGIVIHAVTQVLQAATLTEALRVYTVNQGRDDTRRNTEASHVHKVRSRRSDARSNTGVGA